MTETEVPCPGCGVYEFDLCTCRYVSAIETSLAKDYPPSMTAAVIRGLSAATLVRLLTVLQGRAYARGREMGRKEVAK